MYMHIVYKNEPYSNKYHFLPFALKEKRRYFRGEYDKANSRVNERTAYIFTIIMLTFGQLFCEFHVPCSISPVKLMQTT